MENLQEIFDKKNWKALVVHYSPVVVAKELGFNKSLIAAYHLVYDCNWDETMQEYAVTLAYIVKGMYPSEWGADWKYDAFLGDVCDITLKYDDRYLAYRRAYEKAHPAPPRLLINLARCCDCPGPSPISYVDAIELLQQVIATYPYLDAIGQLKSIYFSTGDQKQEDYWNKIYEELEHKDNKISPPINYSFDREKI